MCTSVCGTSTARAGAVDETRSWIPEENPGSRGPVLPSGSDWAAGEDSRTGSMEANEQRRCLPSHWQDLVNVLLQRVAAQLTHTNLSSVHLPGRLRSPAVSTAAHERFPARGKRRDGGRVEGGRVGESGAWGMERWEGAQYDTALTEACQVAELHGKHKPPPG